jgi:DNA end-binding protein Ku
VVGGFEGAAQGLKKDSEETKESEESEDRRLSSVSSVSSESSDSFAMSSKAYSIVTHSMRALWTGSLNFGLVNIPVKMYSAVDERGGIELDYLHRHDMTPVKYVRVCTHDGNEVPFEDVVKGYEYKEGAYITLEQEDFERANLIATKTVDIHEFAEEKEIDSIFFDKPYFLVPDNGGEKAYAILHDALNRTGKVGIVTFVLRGRGRLGFIKAQGPAIILERLRFEQEVRSPSDVDVPKVDVSVQEADVAVALVDFLTKPFDIRRYRDTYTEELRRVIDEKVRGTQRKIEPAVESAPAKSGELMKLLRASLDSAQGRFSQKKAEPKKKPAKKELHVKAQIH